MAITLTLPVITVTTTAVAPYAAVPYSVYANTGAGDPIDYSTPIGTTRYLTFATSALGTGESWKFAVRAGNYHGEESNTDAVVTVVTDASHVDVTSSPQAPNSLTAKAEAAGAIRVSWSYPLISTSSQTPTGFRVYIGTGGSPSYGSQAATVAFGLSALPAGYRSAGIASPHYTTLLTGPYTNGTTYTVGVRAYNATAEESNTMTADVVADTQAPTSVTSLSAVATPQA